MTRRLGVFGGTFDPPHHGHLIVAAETFEALGLDLLLFVPAGDPPHKPARRGASPEQRLRMTRAAIAGDPRFSADDREIRRGGASYTVDTLRSLREEEPGADLVFLLGVDQFHVFDTWRDPDRIVELARLAVFSRGGEMPRLTGIFSRNAVQAQVSRIDISSTEVRRRAASNQDIRYFVPEAVREIIEGERLYRKF